MNYDEEYWRAKAVEAQRVAAQYYEHAMIARKHETSAARAWQHEAYDAHQKAMARLGWAEVERGSYANAGRYIDHDPNRTSIDGRDWSLNRRGVVTLSPSDIDALATRYPLNRQFGKMRGADEAHHTMPTDPQAFTKALAKLKRGKS